MLSTNLFNTFPKKIGSNSACFGFKSNLVITSFNINLNSSSLEYSASGLYSLSNNCLDVLQKESLNATASSTTCSGYLFLSGAADSNLVSNCLIASDCSNIWFIVSIACF